MSSLREAMDSQNLHQTEVAARVGFSTSQLSRILGGKRPASFTEVVKLAHVLGVDLAEVVRRAERMGQTDPEPPALRFPPAAEVAALELRMSLDAESAGQGNAGVTDQSVSCKGDPRCR